VDAKGAHALFRQRGHLPGRVGPVRVDDGGADEDVPVQGDHVEHVGIIEAVEAHLDEVDAVHAAGAAVLEQVLRREALRVHLLGLVAGGERVVGGVVGPDVDVRVKVTHACLQSGQRLFFPPGVFYRVPDRHAIAGQRVRIGVGAIGLADALWPVLVRM
jgi:hypothetical protein